MSDISQAMRYKIDVKNGLVKQPMTGVLMRGDKKANRIIAELVDGDKTVSLDGVTVTGKFFRGGDSVEILLEGAASGNEATVLLNDHCYAVDGYFEASVKLKTGGATRTILTVTGHVESDGEGGILDIENVIPSVADIVAQYQRMQEVTDQTNAAMQNANEASERANTATGNANAAAGAANQAADAANAAATEAGAAAGKIDNMTVAATALDTGQPPTAALSEVDGHYLLLLGLPRGATGATPQISVQVTTGAPGSQASVSVTGTAENPVIHLTIPRGDTGEIGALKINGKTPDASGAVTLGAEDVGALAEEATAVDSAKLGGKAPEYYLQPINLLDNSDFTNPVNQRGAASIVVNNDVYTYFIDRWCCVDWSGNDDGTLTLTGSGISVTAEDVYFYQRFEKGKINSTKNYTLVVYYSDGSKEITKNPLFSYESSFDTIDFKVTAGKTVSYAALYEGSYTAETLPPYVPKGYAQELAECQMDYYRPDGYCIGIAHPYTTTDAYITIFTPTKMREVSAIVFSNLRIAKNDYMTDGAPSIESISYTNVNSNNITFFAHLTAELALGKEYSVYPVGPVEIISGL